MAEGEDVRAVFGDAGVAEAVDGGEVAGLGGGEGGEVGEAVVGADSVFGGVFGFGALPPPLAQGGFEFGAAGVELGGRLCGGLEAV